nr:MAG TPA: hypothetical protein [Caudoviricetes sp.]
MLTELSIVAWFVQNYRKWILIVLKYRQKCEQACEGLLRCFTSHVCSDF